MKTNLIVYSWNKIDHSYILLCHPYSHPECRRFTTSKRIIAGHSVQSTWSAWRGRELAVLAIPGMEHCHLKKMLFIDIGVVQAVSIVSKGEYLE